MTDINQRQEEIVEEFNDFDDWMDRYSLLIDLGNQLPPMDEALKTPDNLIDGCQSRVWLDSELTPEGTMHFQADSDAMIVKGIIALLTRVLEGATPQQVLDTPLTFIDSIGLSEHLSPTRSNGLVAMVKQIRAYALAFKAKQEAAGK